MDGATASDDLGPRGEPQSTQQRAASAPTFCWSGDPWSLAQLCVLNFLLTLLTLGIYIFWGKTEIRKRIWFSIRLADEPLEYAGTGKELFLGFVVVSCAIMFPFFVLSTAALLTLARDPLAEGIVQYTVYAVTFYWVSVGLYRARGYRLSRTCWRGIRGALKGTPWHYGWSSLWTIFLVPSLGCALLAVTYLIHGPKTGPLIADNPPAIIAIVLLLFIAWLLMFPWRAVMLQRLLTNNMFFGDRPFCFHASARPLYTRFAARWAGVVVLAGATVAAIFLVVGPKLLVMMEAAENSRPRDDASAITTGEVVIIVAILLLAAFLNSIVTAWYRAAEANFLAAATRFGNASFRLNFSAGGLVQLFVTNALITYLSLGILRPVAEARAVKFFVERLTVDGDAQLDDVRQSAGQLGRTGEGLAQVFDGHGL